jgi:hypothetical protein
VLRLAILLASFAVAAQAAEFPPTITVETNPLVLNGTAVRSVWGFKVYRVALYLVEPSSDADHIMNRDRGPKRIHMIMLRPVANEKFTATVRENIEQNLEAAEKERFRDELQAYLGHLQQGGDLTAGATITIDYLPQRGMVLRHDGREVGTIPGEDFYHLMLRLWIGRPLQESIKTGLLNAP